MMGAGPLAALSSRSGPGEAGDCMLGKITAIRLCGPDGLGRLGWRVEARPQCKFGARRLLGNTSLHAAVLGEHPHMLWR
jgi:hypothetical protein